MSAQSRIKSVLKPVNDLVMINVETTGEILLRQNAFFGDVVKASIDQAKTLAEANSMRDALDAQRAYFREVGSKVTEVSRENLETLRTGGQHARSVLTGAYRKGREEASEAVRQGQESASEAADRGREAIDRGRQNVADAVAPEPQQYSSGDDGQQPFGS